MIVLYLITLVASSGLIGVFGRNVLAQYGYVAGFQTGVLLAGGIAALYAASQCAYMALLRFLEPTKSRAPYFAEILSHLSMAILLPYMSGYEVNWPHDSLYKVEPLIYLAAFGVLHLFFKLASFYGSLQGELGSRLSPLGWLAAMGACLLTSFIAITRWIGATEAAIPEAPPEQAFYQIGNERAEGRRIPEGATYTWDISGTPGQSLAVRWARAPIEEPETDIDTVFTTVIIEGDDTKDFHAAADLDDSGWVAVHVPALEFPRNAKRATVRWAREETPSWQRLVGISPVVYGEARSEGAEAAVRPVLLMSGPFMHQERPEAAELSFLIVVIDGLSAKRMSLLGDAERTTPNLDRLASVSLSFVNAFTPGLDPDAVIETLLTGLVPMRQSTADVDTSKKTPALPPLLQSALYATAAFVDETDDARIPERSSLERGFELLVETPTNEDPWAQSFETLERARTWINEHVEEKFLAVVRINALAATMQSTPITTASYDEAITRTDALVGNFVEAVRNAATRKSTCIVVTAPTGLDVGSPKAPYRLSDPVLHIPLILHVPGLGAATRVDTVGLEDLAPSLAIIGDVSLPNSIDGRNVLNGPNGNRPISVAGDPPTLSVRSTDYRYTWVSPGAEPAGPIGLFRANVRGGEWWTQDMSSRDAERARRYREEVESYFQRQQNRRR